jgi:TldD protein
LQMDSISNKIFFQDYGLDKSKINTVVSDALSGMDDGELFMEYTVSEAITLDEGTIKSASFDTTQGFGLRGIVGEATGYAHSSILSEDSIKKAAQVIKAVKNNAKTYKIDTSPVAKQKNLYTNLNPLDEISFQEKVKLLNEIDAYLRAKNTLVKQVNASIAGEWQVVHIIRGNGFEISDIRPLVRLNISVMVEKDGRREKGSYGAGGRTSYKNYITVDKWKHAADEALREAMVNLEAVAGPAGEMDVVLGNGWNGILLHEAIGHGLEGDFNRKKTSAFANLMGQQIAAKGVTVVDDGTLDNRRGSLTVDDEGTPTNRTVLIEDGILVGYMQDRMNARLMGMKPTGNGRRESYEYPVLPRMTNTYMLGGTQSQEELIKQVKKGIFAVSFGGGQVDITSGKFVFSANEAYKIEDGKIGAPIKGATLIGNGPDCLTKIKAIANDMELDPGIGTCGKDGQGVPVGVGQPSMLIGGLTVGGTEV